MPVNFRDVEMLQSSMRGLGDSFAQNRQESEARKQREIDNSLRQRMLENQEKTMARAEAGTTEAWLTGDDGGLVHYKGTPDGLQKVLQGAQQQGKTLKMTQPPQKRASIGSFSTSTPLGDFTFHMDSPEDVDKVMEQAKKIGGAKKGGDFKTAPIANAEHIASLQAAIDQATTPAEKMKAEQALQTFTDLVKRSKEAELDPNAKDLEYLNRKRLDAEASGDEESLTKIDTAISKRQPKGLGGLRKRDEELMANAEQPTPLPLPPDKTKLVKGQVYQTSRGPATWNGTAFEQ